MFIHKSMYCVMTDKQLHKIAVKLGQKLESENNIKKQIKYLNMLADVGKVVLHRNRNNEVFMKYVTNELNALKAQIEDVL